MSNKLIIAALILIPVGCATMQSLDPVETPPTKYQNSRPVLVEFVPPEMVTIRCFQRGSLIPANACADREIITITNPCKTTNESYAKRLCHELAHVNGWADGQK